MNKTYLGYTLTILSALAFASMSLFIKMGYGVGMSPWSFAVIQSSFALVLLVVMWFRSPGPAPGLGRPKLRDVLLFMLFGATTGITFNLSLFHLSMSLATILLFTYPAFTALGAWLVLGQRPTLLHGGAILLTLVGAVLTANLPEIQSGTISLLGVGLALLSAVAQGLYMVVGEKVAGKLTAISATTLTRIAILSGTILLKPSVFGELPSVPQSGWLICLVAAIVAGVPPFFFLNRGVALIGANRAAIASVAELPFALGLGLIFQGDLISLTQWVGAALIIAAVVISQHESEEEATHGSGTGAAGSL
ncbi:MAG TPA: DMT family transporter [Symbiobacteriaceae bacterium]|nr:DMT family transporter [Symbiobacteriaceae bacterium]